jgi:hypothetical protein
VHTYILITLTAVLSMGVAGVMVALGWRTNTGSRPRPGDAIVTEIVTALDWPTDGEAIISVAIANPGPVPVLVGLLLRRQLLPVGWRRITVAGRTTSPRYLASAQAAVAAVAGGETDRLTAPVPSACARRRWRLVIMIGQPDCRLQVISAPVAIVPGPPRIPRLTRRPG